MTVLPVSRTVSAAHALRQQPVPRGLGRSEVQVGQPRGEHPVHLLGKGMVPVAGAQAGLDVARGDALEVGGEGRGEGRHGVALHQQDVGPQLAEQRRQPVEHPGRDARGRLARRHDLEIVVGGEREDIEHLVQHVAVLGRDADDALELVGA